MWLELHTVRGESHTLSIEAHHTMKKKNLINNSLHQFT